MNTPPIETISFLTVIVIAILGGFWQFIKKAGENKNRYQKDVQSLRSIIIASELLPNVVQLIEKVESHRTTGNISDIERILSDYSFALDLKNLVNSSQNITEIENLYLGTTNFAFKCAYDLLLAAILPVVTLIWLFLDTYWEYFIPIIIFSTIVMVIKALFDVLKYTKNLRAFIKKDDEIRFGRSE